MEPPHQQLVMPRQDSYKHVDQNILDPRHSLQNSMECRSRETGDSFVRDETGSNNAEDRPIVQERATNIFGTSPVSKSDGRPKTAAYLGSGAGQKLQSVT